MVVVVVVVLALLLPLPPPAMRVAGHKNLEHLAASTPTRSTEDVPARISMQQSAMQFVAIVRKRDVSSAKSNT